MGLLEGDGELNHFVPTKFRELLLLNANYET